MDFLFEHQWSVSVVGVVAFGAAFSLAVHNRWPHLATASPIFLAPLFATVMGWFDK